MKNYCEKEKKKLILISCEDINSVKFLLSVIDLVYYTVRYNHLRT